MKTISFGVIVISIVIMMISSVQKVAPEIAPSRAQQQKIKTPSFDALRSIGSGNGDIILYRAESKPSNHAICMLLFSINWSPQHHIGAMRSYSQHGCGSIASLRTANQSIQSQQSIFNFSHLVRVHRHIAYIVCFVHLIAIKSSYRIFFGYIHIRIYREKQTKKHM